MMKSAALASLLSLTLCGQALPERPEQLVFAPQRFELPRAASCRARLKNGIPVYLAPQGDSAFVRIHILVRAGAFLDPKGKEGLAALAGAMMRDGGTAALAPDALDRRVDFLAGSIKTGLGETSGEFSMEFLAKDLKEGLDLFLQVVEHPAFAPERLDQARQAALQSLSARNDSIDSIGRYQLPFLLNGGGHFSSARPTEASLMAITREDLAAFHANLLCPGNLVVTAAGGFKRAELLDQLERTLGGLKAAQGKASPRPPAPAFTRVPGVYVVDKAVPQTLVRFALPGLRRTDPDWHAALVMNHILGGGGFTARLMKRIRSDEGLTYGISTSFSEGPYWQGNWAGGFQTKNRSAAFALRLLREELERIAREEVADEELAVAKAALVEAFPTQWANPGKRALGFAADDLAGWPEDGFADFRKQVGAVTKADVLKVAKAYLDPARMVVLVVGDAAQVEAGDAKDHPGLLKDALPLPLQRLALRDPRTFVPVKDPVQPPTASLATSPERP